MDIDISIKEFREFVSENPYEEIWRQLYYFTDVDSINKKIRERFKIEKKDDTNSKKQAQQLAYSIIQAKNYFESARYVDVSVKPNLIYYGMSSLANTVILYNNNGTFSLDYIRDRKKENHHGLDDKFSFKSLNKDAPLQVQDILKSISCVIHTESQKTYKSYGLLADVEYDEENMELKKPYGHFKNFYKSIVPECVFAEKTYQNELVDKDFFYIDKPNIEDLVHRKFDLITMFGFLPDMIQQLPNNAIFSNLCQGFTGWNAYLAHPNQDEESGVENQVEYQIINFYINMLSTEKKEYFKNLCSQNKAIEIYPEYPTNLRFLYDSRKESDDSYYPDMVQDLFGQIYFIYNAEEYIQELANLYICFFCTGMLCRYYPDYWMYWIEKNVGFKHLMETLCSIAIRKFPNLILNQLTQCINYFHL